MGVSVNMTWRWAAASVAGTSHAITGEACQDACAVRLFSRHDGDKVLGIFVADGAGSARHGGEGAAAAVYAASLFWGEHLVNAALSVDPASMGRCVEAIRSRLESLAGERGESVRECACTFMSVLATPRDVVTFQIGDGGIVLDCGDGYSVATEPMNGEYANTTYFITESEDRISAGEGIWHSAPAKRIGVFTDGIQRLALDQALRKPNPHFFDRRFATLEAAAPDQRDQLEPALAAFLACEAINRHTDDDKTLVLASFLPE